MSKPGFVKIKSSNAPFYGLRALILCGFSSNAQSKFASLLAMLGLKELPMIWVSADHSKEPVGDLFQHTNGFGAGDSSSLPRAIIVGGIMEKELQRLMVGCRKAGMKQALWATLTPTSEKWPLEQLIGELQAEHRALSTNKKSSARH